MLKHITVIVAGLISILYLLNIGVGIIELIPDNVPFVGNLDEGGAVVVLIMCLRYFGMDVARLFERDKR